ncbi:unnamed protein product [Rotaria sordida]|uniref:EGF-like domain-containing protein n=1 Tax=Rotaria sordida TaxID=392033 RepID=A0A813YBH2_9BILA|nr:unnamed protein product [Rotaria sordida]
MSMGNKNQRDVPKSCDRKEMSNAKEHPKRSKSVDAARLRRRQQKDIQKNHLELNSLEEYGYHFENGKLVSIIDGKPFEFHVHSNNDDNRVRYNGIGRLVTNYIYDLLEEKECGLQRIKIPLDAKKSEPTGFFFASEDFDTAEYLMIIIHGSGVVRAGQWSRSLIINEDLAAGSQLDYIKQARINHYAVIVTNTNLNTDESSESILNIPQRIRGSGSAEEHACYIWEKFVRRCRARHICIMAHSYGGAVVLELASKYMSDFDKRVFAIALTDSPMRTYTKHFNKNVSAILKKKTINWIADHHTVNTILTVGDYGIIRSAGHLLHEWTSYTAFQYISFIINDTLIYNISEYFLNKQNFNENNLRCSSLLNPIEFLISSTFLSFELSEYVQQMINYQLNISFHFQTYSSDAILLYCTNKFNDDFLGFDLIDGFFYITINLNKKKQRQELFQQRFNNGQTHFIFLHIQGYQGGLEFNITMNYRQSTRIIIPHSLSKIHLHTLTIGGINPNIQWLPDNYWSGIMHRGLIGCFSDLELNNEAINLTKYINNTNNNITPKSGPCLTTLLSKRECSCEHGGECRLNNGGIWSCDCSKTGYTGRRCEHATYHIDLNQIHTFELNTNLQWSQQINDVAFGLQAIHDQENFLELRPCRQSLECDSINFSIRNGLLQINFYYSNKTINITEEQPFIIDNQWHYIHLYRIDTKLLLHIDHHISQQRMNIIETNQTLLSTIWLILNGNQQIRIEDLRIYDQSINSKFFLNKQYEQIELKHRIWKPSNSISFYEQQDSYITISLNDILCQECELDTIYFDFRTTELTGLILFANIQTNNPKMSYSLDNTIDKDGQYLVIKLVDGQLHLIVLIASLHEDEDEIYQIQTKTRFNDGQWHHISLHRGSDYHLELIIDSHQYYLLTSIHFIDTIYFGRPSFLSSDILPFNHINTLKTCLASLTINSRLINLHEYIKTNLHIRNDCFLESQCPLRHCQNTGICINRIKCDCQHTSFQGDFCTELKIGYFFNQYTSGLIFDQPFQIDNPLLNYKISFGIVTKMISGEIICVSDQLQIELYRGHIRIKLITNNNHNNEYIENDIMINNGYYHLVQIQYNSTGYLYLNVDNKSILKQLTYRLSFDKPLLLLIGQNPAFRHGFQGQLYGLESDIYSVFDMISPTFQRISYSPIQDKIFSSSSLSSPSSSIIYPSSHIQNDLIPSLCSPQSYDDICIITSDTSLSLLSYPNVTLLTFSPTKKLLSSSSSSSSSSISPSIISRYTTTSYITSTISYQINNFSTLISSNYTFNSTYYVEHPPLIVSVRTHTLNRSRKIFYRQKFWIILIPVLCGTILCLIFAICGFIKYRRKDVGVYEVEEAQRFRPLIVELNSSPGERNQENLNSTTTSTNTSLIRHVSKKDNIKSHKNRKRKKSPLTTTDEQREFYI